MANITITLDDSDKTRLSEFCEQNGKATANCILKTIGCPIYQKKDDNLVLELTRTGTHSDLFERQTGSIVKKMMSEQ